VLPSTQCTRKRSLSVWLVFTCYLLLVIDLPDAVLTLKMGG